MYWQLFWDSRQIFLAPQWLIALFAGVIGLFFLPKGDRAVAAIHLGLAKLGRRRWVAILSVFAFAFLLGAIPWMFGRVRPPAIHDEISYLLAADTYLHGRLTNPPHQFWRNFQTFHELMQPTYMSKFPVGQGMALAIGKMLGAYRIGAFGAIAIASAAVCWMLMAIVPPRWAIIGGLLTVMQPLFYSWGQSYWGGGVSMIGGALVTGAVFRIGCILRNQSTAVPTRSRPHKLRLFDHFSAYWKPTLIGGIGYGICLNSRPLEGTIFSAICLIWLTCRAQSRKAAHEMLWLRIVPFGIASLMPFFAFMAYNDYRVTGNAFTLPYSVHSKQYMRSPLFWWQTPNEPSMSRVPPHMASFHAQLEAGEWTDQRSVSGFFLGIERKILFVSRDAFVPIALLIVLVAGLPLALRRWTAHASLAVGACVGLLLVHMLITPWLRSQYLGPIAPLYISAIVLSLRALNRWKPLDRPIGSIAAIALLVVLPSLALPTTFKFSNYKGSAEGEEERFIEKICETPGKHLVFVVYVAGPQEMYEWVHNAADIDSQRVILAHPLDEDSAARLAEHYPDRTIWVLNVSYQGLSWRWLRQPQSGS